MEILGVETCFSAKVHFLITKVGKDKLNERSFSLTPEGCIDWEKACSYLPGNVYERIFYEGKNMNLSNDRLNFLILYVDSF